MLLFCYCSILSAVLCATLMINGHLLMRKAIMLVWLLVVLFVLFLCVQREYYLSYRVGLSAYCLFRCSILAQLDTVKNREDKLIELVNCAKKVASREKA